MLPSAEVLFENLRKLRERLDNNDVRHRTVALEATIDMLTTAGYFRYFGVERRIGRWFRAIDFYINHDIILVWRQYGDGQLSAFDVFAPISRSDDQEERLAGLHQYLTQEIRNDNAQQD